MGECALNAVCCVEKRARLGTFWGGDPLAVVVCPVCGLWTTPLDLGVGRQDHHRTSSCNRTIVLLEPSILSAAMDFDQP